ncbi:hypothetical protein AOLI_G00204070 [Acnodon oligacanthus]
MRTHEYQSHYEVTSTELSPAHIAQLMFNALGTMVQVELKIKESDVLRSDHMNIKVILRVKNCGKIGRSGKAQHSSGS